VSIVFGKKFPNSTFTTALKWTVGFLEYVIRRVI
jgi:hypothetical protein